MSFLPSFRAAFHLHRAWLHCLIFLLALPCLAGPATAVSGATGDPTGTISFRQAEPGYSFRFPRDHGSHDDFQTEWWYYTGHLIGGNGHEYGFELTFFRRGMADARVAANPSRWTIRQLYLAHAAISDFGGRQFRYAEKISRAGIGKAGAETGRLHVWIDRWKVDMPAGQEAHHLRAAGDGFAIDLALEPQTPPIIHGEGGISRKGARPGQASHYYSFTRMAATGTLTIDGQAFPVSGSTWMDHEFGSGDLGDDQVGWDWFSIQLEDGTDLMFYLLRRTDGTPDRASSGTLVSPDGTPLRLSVADVRIDVQDRWTSPTSGAIYPSRWRLSIPSADLTLELAPKLADQELITRKSTRVTYWEGAVSVKGMRHAAPVAGRGYVEMTGYAEPFKARDAAP